MLSANDPKVELLLPMFAAMTTVMIALLTMMIYRDVLKRKKSGIEPDFKGVFEALRLVPKKPEKPEDGN